MSRHAQLPPRCPLQKKTGIPAPNFSVPPPLGKDIELDQGQYGHYTSVPQSSILEEQPPWLNDLLSDSDSTSNGGVHRGATSDSSTLIDGLVASPDPVELHEKNAEYSCEQDDDQLGSTCMYGPNSPRRKDKLGFPQNEIASVFSEYVMQNPLQHFDGYSSGSGVLQSDSFGDDGALADPDNFGNNQVKRYSHPGQRSRARKLQYISELENNVGVLQNIGSELAVRVASLIQQYTALSMENNTLKQQLLRMKQKTIVVDGEYQSLMKELERLRSGLAFAANNKNHHHRFGSAANLAHSDAVWNMLDLRKLNLN